MNQRRDPKDIAKDVRTAARAARTEGTLTIPAGSKISVRVERASCHTSIEVEFTDTPPGWHLTDGTDRLGRPDRVVSPDAAAAGQLMEKLIDQHGAHRTWGQVTCNGIVLATCSPSSWTPGQD